MSQNASSYYYSLIRPLTFIPSKILILHYRLFEESEISRFSMRIYFQELALLRECMVFICHETMVRGIICCGKIAKFFRELFAGRE